MNKKTWTEDQLKEAVKSSQSIRQTLNKIGLVEAGGNYAIIKWWIKKLDIDTSHFLGQGWLKGKTHNYTKPHPLKEVMTSHSNYQSFKLKNRLIKDGILKPLCSSCGLTQWKSRTTNFEKRNIPLELEHKNGNKFDNRLENLELLCPTCHAFTHTYRGKNKKKVNRPRR